MEQHIVADTARPIENIIAMVIRVIKWDDINERGKMKINMKKYKDEIYFSYWTMWGLGHERTVAIYYPAKNILQIHDGCANFLRRILHVLGKHVGIVKPVEVRYW